MCGEAETARDARAAIKELSPDVVIADISLKQGDGIELVRDVRAHHPQLPILVLSMHDETIYAERMLSAGANGYIMKQAASEQFLVSLRRVLDGGIYVSEAVGNNMIQKFAAGGSYISANPIDRLSNRELQILHMIGKGMSTRETAHSLNLSIKTVESHRQRIKRKLNLTTGTQLVQYAVNWFTGREGGGARQNRGCRGAAGDAESARMRRGLKASRRAGRRSAWPQSLRRSSSVTARCRAPSCWKAMARTRSCRSDPRRMLLPGPARTRSPSDCSRRAARERLGRGRGRKFMP